MSTLIVSDVFEAYYEGRKGAFSADQAKSEASGREEKRRPEPANKDERVPRAA